MATLQIRLKDDVFAEVKRRGGSPWARDVILRELAGGGTSDPPPDPRPVPAEPPPQEPISVASEGKTQFCPRWMHHRKGVFCKTCETTP